MQPPGATSPCFADTPGHCFIEGDWGQAPPPNSLMPPCVLLLTDTQDFLWAFVLMIIRILTHEVLKGAKKIQIYLLIN